MIKNQLNQFLSDWKNLKLRILVLEYKKRNDCKTFYSRTKLITGDSDTDEAFTSTHQNIMTKMKDYASEDLIVLDVVIKHSIKIFSH